MKPPATWRAVQLAEEHFGTNLACAFVGGSYARRTQKAVSDIDVFVVIHHSDREAETAFAHALRFLHDHEGLVFDHCGELFDTATLDGLLTFTERSLEATPAIQHAACYQGDCPLSVFRKGDVVFKFLADPKIHVLDPAALLSPLQSRADAYFRRWPMPRVQEHKAHLRLPPGTRQADLADTFRRRSATEQWTDTPVGVGLERWFGPALLSRARALPVRPATTAPLSPRACPLPDLPPGERRAYGAQCLALPHQPSPEDQ